MLSVSVALLNATLEMHKTPLTIS